MGGEITTQMGISHTAHETRAAAVRYLERKGYGDLLPVLGLAEPEPVGERLPCPACGKPLPDPLKNGGNKPCQRRACSAGPTARGVKR